MPIERLPRRLVCVDYDEASACGVLKTQLPGTNLPRARLRDDHDRVTLQRIFRGRARCRRRRVHISRLPSCERSPMFGFRLHE